MFLASRKYSRFRMDRVILCNPSRPLVIREPTGETSPIPLISGRRGGPLRLTPVLARRAFFVCQKRSIIQVQRNCFVRPGSRRSNVSRGGLRGAGGASARVRLIGDTRTNADLSIVRLAERGARGLGSQGCVKSHRLRRRPSGLSLSSNSSRAQSPPSNQWRDGAEGQRVVSLPCEHGRGSFHQLQVRHSPFKSAGVGREGRARHSQGRPLCDCRLSPPLCCLALSAPALAQGAPPAASARNYRSRRARPRGST